VFCDHKQTSLKNKKRSKKVKAIGIAFELAPTTNKGILTIDRLLKKL
jgi:hypothetical protein